MSNTIIILPITSANVIEHHTATARLRHVTVVMARTQSWIPLPFLGWGLLSQFSPFRYFPHFPLLSKQKLAIEYHVCIWQVSPQLCCGDTCQIWMWFRESNRYFCEIENFAYGEISERSFSNPHPCTSVDPYFCTSPDQCIVGFHNSSRDHIGTVDLDVWKSVNG